MSFHRWLGRSLFVVVLLAGIHPARAETVPTVLARDSVLEADKANELRWPVAVAVGGAEIAVADARGARLVVFREDAGTWTARGHVELGAAPAGVVHDGRQWIVALRGPGLVSVAAPGATPRPIRLPANAAPLAMTRTANSLLVYDAAFHRVFRLVDREVVDTFDVDARLSALAPAEDGFYATVSEAAEVRRYGRRGELLDRWTVPGVAPRKAWPVALASSDSGVVVVDRHGNRVLFFDAGGELAGQGGRRGWEAGELLRPAGVAALADGRFAVVDQGNARVQVFRRLEGR